MGPGCVRVRMREAGKGGSWTIRSGVVGVVLWMEAPGDAQGTLSGDGRMVQRHDGTDTVLIHGSMWHFALIWDNLLGPYDKDRPP